MQFSEGRNNATRRTCLCTSIKADEPHSQVAQHRNAPTGGTDIGYCKHTTIRFNTRSTQKTSLRQSPVSRQNWGLQCDTTQVIQHFGGQLRQENTMDRHRTYRRNRRSTYNDLGRIKHFSYIYSPMHRREQLIGIMEHKKKT